MTRRYGWVPPIKVFSKPSAHFPICTPGDCEFCYNTHPMTKAKQNNNILKKVFLAFAVCIVVLVCILFVAVQAASAGNRLQDSSSFGIGNNRFSVDAQVGVISNGEFEGSEHFDSQNTSLATYSTRDISTAISAISFRIESAAKAAAEAAKSLELAKANNAKNRRNEHARTYGMPSGLSEVNWDVSKLDFVAE